MHRGKLPWDHVRFFLALTRARSFGEAGREVGVDGSTVARRLDALERTLDAVLFERRRDGIQMTEAAERLKPVAEEMEHAVARFTGTVESFERDVTGTVRIACPGDTAAVLLAPRLSKLFEAHGGLRVEIVPGDRLVDMARREADIALRTVRPTFGDLVSTRLFPVRWCLAASEGLRERTGRLERWEDVAWVGGAGTLQRATPGQWFSTFVRGVEPVVRTDDLAFQIACVRAGVGAALLPEPSVEYYELVSLELDAELEASVRQLGQDNLFMITHRALRSVPRVRAVWEFLRGEGEHMMQLG